MQGNDGVCVHVALVKYSPLPALYVCACLCVRACARMRVCETHLSVGEEMLDVMHINLNV